VLACDLIWAAASARFGQLEATIGTTTLLGGVQHLGRTSCAREVIYTPEPYEAATFERWNIVNRVVADDAFESQTRGFTERLANGPTLAYAAGKRMVRAYWTAAYAPQIRLLARSGCHCFHCSLQDTGFSFVAPGS
jgi:enoyl-CoA hydratase/carnithine racemase